MAPPSPRPYPSDLTDEQWWLIEPMVPVKLGGRPAKHPRRRIVNAILYVNRTGCLWTTSAAAAVLEHPGPHDSQEARWMP